MKKTWLLTLFAFLILPHSLGAAIAIISDLDDTIKITEGSGDPRDILGSKTYTGMSAFFKEAKAYAPDLYILSASPSLIRSRINYVLKKNEVDYKSLILRKNIFEDKFSFKVKEIAKILENSSDDFILIGDDVGKDPEVYTEIKRLYPERILKAYIHKVTGREAESDAVVYWTSFDLALREFLEGRMDSSQVQLLIENLKQETEMRMVFPKKADCPEAPTVWEWQLSTIFQPEAQELIQRFVNFCQPGQSDIILE